MLEVCIDNLESAINAIKGGAEELEICSSLSEGGLTPSFGLVSEIIKMVDNIKSAKLTHSINIKYSDENEHNIIVPKINVMIRCRTGSDFCYSQLEIDTMLADIEAFKSADVDRFVFGALTENQKIDLSTCRKVIEKAFPVPVTFHRAFDVCKDPIEAMTDVIGLGFSRVLTSGQRSSAADPEAIVLIQSLVQRFGDGIQIMPGAGVNVENARKFTDIGCKIVHGSCKKRVYLRKVDNNLNMGTSNDEFIFVTDENIVRSIKKVIEL